MGTSRTAAEFVGKMKRLPDALDRQATIRVARIGRDVTVKAEETELRRVAPRNKLVNVGKKGRKVGVRSQQVNSGGNRIGEFVVAASGPWQLFENGTKPHFIVARGYRGSRRSRQERAARSMGGGAKMGRAKASPKVLSFGGRAAAYVLHPGTKARSPWAKGKRVAEKRAPKEMSAQVQREIRKVIK